MDAPGPAIAASLMARRIAEWPEAMGKKDKNVTREPP